MSEHDVDMDDLEFADEARLRHEIRFLREHLGNLEEFKKLFFTLRDELVAEHAEMAELRQRLESQSNADDAAHGNLPTAEKQIHQLETDLHNTQDMASVAMTTMSEYGLVIDFFKESVTAASYQDLVMLLFMAVSGYGLEATVLIRSVHGELIFAQNEKMKDQDVAYIQHNKTQGRIVNQQDMVLINFTNISLLARYFPDDQEKAGRIRNYLTTLCYGVNGRVDAIDANSRLKKERQNLYVIVSGATQAMTSIKASLGEHIQKSDEVFKQMVQKMNETFIKLDISEKNRNLLGGIMQAGASQLGTVLGKVASLDEKFAGLLARLEQRGSSLASKSKSEKVQKE